MAQLASALRSVGEAAEADELSAQAVQLAVGDVNAEFDALRTRAEFLMATPAAASELLLLGNRAVDLAIRAERPLAELWGRSWKADAAFRLGNRDAADAELLAMRQLEVQTRFPLVRWHVLRQQASREMLAGSFEAAREHSLEALTVAHRLGDLAGVGMHHSFCIRLAALRWDATELAPGWEGANLAAPPLATVRAGRAMAKLLQGDPEEAAAIYSTLRRPPARPEQHYLFAVDLVVRLAIAFRDAEAFRPLRSLVDQIAQSCRVWGTGTVAYTGAVSRLAAELALDDADVDDAIVGFDAALVTDQRLGAYAMVVLDRLGLAAALAKRAIAGDRMRAHAMAREAAREARRLDMPGSLARADSILRELEAWAREVDPLTPREREVAQLVVQGLSNHAIADRLVISERTVESHVRNVLGKTGANSRIDLVRLLLQEWQDR
ncbi:MAG: helix-turn-helix transcriptional regulator [Gammaproteobacteria bacterium]